MIAGGASLAPRRWSLPAWATDARSRSACRCTARITAAQKTRNWAFCSRVFAGIEQVAHAGSTHRPVDVLARAVDAGEGLFVQQAGHAVLLGHAGQGLHDRSADDRWRRWRFRRAGPIRTGPGPLRCGGFWPARPA